MNIDNIIDRVKIDIEHDIPYLGGYSQDGKTIYLDRHMPLFWGAIPVFKTIAVHEIVEKGLERSGFDYQSAHEVATLVEHSFLGDKAQGYEEFLKPYIKGADKEKLSAVPADLDLEPYMDMRDYEKLKEIAEVNKCTSCPHNAIVKNVRV